MTVWIEIPAMLAAQPDEELARGRLARYVALPDQFVFRPAQFEVLDLKMVRVLLAKRDEKWFL